MSYLTCLKIYLVIEVEAEKVMKRAFGLYVVGVMLVVGSSANADTYPHQRLGLWNSTMTSSGRSMSVKSCVDAASEAQANVLSQSVRKNAMCQSLGISHNPDGSWTSSTSCEFRKGVKTVTRTDVTGDFKSHVKFVIHAMPSNKVETTMDMTWLGPCLPGQKGGDVIKSDGRVMNTLAVGREH